MNGPHPTFTLEPWQVRELHLDIDVLAQTESVFALSNGHLGLRGNLDEGEPFGAPGTYVSSVYEKRPLPYPEGGYGYPESGQTIIDVTNGKLFRLLVDDEPFDVRYGDLLSHERTLDLRDGVLRRELHWSSPAGQQIRLRTTRLVSFTQRAIAAIEYEVEAVNDEARVVVQSELVANEPAPPPASDDPRVAAALESPLVSEINTCRLGQVALVHRTARSGLRVAAAMEHIVQGPGDTLVEHDAAEDIGRTTVTTRLEPGQKLRIVKFLAYGWSSTRSRQALYDQVTAALTAARHTGWNELLVEQRRYLDDFWDRADVEVEGDPEIQQAVRFGMFHTLQAGARTERRAIPAKGLTGNGYDGHAFWDTEAFVLPLLTYTLPDAAADALRWRHSILPQARERAKALGLQGAAFPWRTLDGEECSAYWPAGTAAFHINSAVADAVIRYVDATEDDTFEEQFGLELLVETARLWRSLGHHDREGRFRIDGVTGPDEYSAIADNNVYTNLMAQENLRGAADAVERHPEQSLVLGVGDDEAAGWRAAAADMYIPFDARLRVHPQADAFTDHRVWDFANTPADHYPLMRSYPYFDLYRKQVVKQSDLVLAMYRRGEYFDDDQKARNFAYYERLTVRDSSLSACIQSVMAAEVGHLDLAYDYLAEAALVDLMNLHNNTGDGLHIASLAGGWIALVGGLGGMRVRHGELRFSPRLPQGIVRLQVNLIYRGRRLNVSITAHEATYSLQHGDPLVVVHHGEKLLLDGDPQTRAVPDAPTRPRPTQPAGRAPLPRLLRRT
jgi:alpha,alpha-trehalose phosphorylase